MGGSALSSSLPSASTSMAAPTAVEAAEAVDDDIYRSYALIFVVAEPSDERMVRTKDTLCRPRRWPLALVGRYIRAERSLGVVRVGPPARHGTRYEYKLPYVCVTFYIFGTLLHTIHTLHNR